MTIRYTPRARSDLDTIFEFIAKENEPAAIRVLHAIAKTAELIGDRPYIGIKNARAADRRSRLVVGYPYRIHYTVRGTDVAILHIRHTSRRPWVAE